MTGTDGSYTTYTYSNGAWRPSQPNDQPGGSLLVQQGQGGRLAAELLHLVIRGAQPPRLHRSAPSLTGPCVSGRRARVSWGRGAALRRTERGSCRKSARSARWTRGCATPLRD